jgi:PAS domain S-box-containing protein
VSPKILLQRSLKTRVTLFSLTIFVIGIWSLAFYASRILREDMTRMLSDQQFSTVSLLAAAVNAEMDQQLRSLEAIAGSIGPALLSDKAALQSLLEQRQVLQSLFSGGTFATGMDGTVIADVPLSTGRIGANFMEMNSVSAALKEGKTTIGQPVMGKQLKAPVFFMSAPIRNTQGTVIGALTGVVNLGKPGFLDRIAEGRYGLSGGYVLVASPYRLVVAASDKSRIMGALPAPGITPLIDRYVQGDEGSGIFTNIRGVEVLASAKSVPVAGWYVGVQLPTAEAFAPIHAMQQRLLLATTLLTLLAGGLTWWMLRRQLAPMLAAAKSLAILPTSGPSREFLPITTQDEIGQLIGGFNRLLEGMRQRDDAMRESEQHFRTLANGGSALIWTSGLDKRCDYFNEPWLRFTGRSLEQELGDGWTEGVHPDDFDRCLQTYTCAFDQHKPFSMDYRIRHADGSYRWISDDGTPRYDRQGKFLGYIGFCSDITERKRTETLLAEREYELRAVMESAHERLAAFAAEQNRFIEAERKRLAREVHDQIGQVLTAIKLIINSIPREAFPPGQEAALTQALDMGITTTRKITSELRPPLLDDLGFAAALDHFIQGSAKLGNLSCEVDIDAQTALNASQGMALFRIAQEAMTNILRHAGATHILITGRKDGSRYDFCIEDDGCGFTPAGLREGSMGLMNMRERALLIGGSCEITPGAQGGTRVTVSLPLDDNVSDEYSAA